MSLQAELKQSEILAHFQKNLSASGRSPAYLISGHRGLGKAVLARSIAEIALQDPRVSLADQTFQHPDLQFIGEDFEAKTIKIEEIRQIQSWLSLKPFQADWKVVIVYEAERLTVEAQNAFLKTLEEPPPQTLLIFTSVNSLQLLPTILSRLQQFRLKPLSTDEIIDAIREEFGLREEASFVAYQARGSLEKARLMSDDGFLEFRKFAFDAFFENRFLHFLKNLEEKEKQSLPKYAENLVDLFLALIRDVLAMNAGLKNTEKFLVNKDYLHELTAFAEGISRESLLEAMEQFRKLKGYLSGYVSVKMILSNLTVVLTRLQNEAKPEKVS